MIKLTKRLIDAGSQRGAGNDLRVSKTWLSNGHWMIKKASVLNSGAFATVASAKDYFRTSKGTPSVPCTELREDQAEKMAASGGKHSITYTRSEWTHTNHEGIEARLFTSSHKDPKPCLINRTYCDAFDLHTLGGTSPDHPLFSNDGTFVVMGIRDADKAYTELLSFLDEEPEPEVGSKGGKTS